MCTHDCISHQLYSYKIASIQEFIWGLLRKESFLCTFAYFWLFVLCTHSWLYFGQIWCPGYQMYFFGIPNGKKGWHVFDLENQRIFLSWMFSFMRTFILLLHLAYFFLNPVVHPIGPMAICLTHFLSILTWLLLHPQTSLCSPSPMLTRPNCLFPHLPKRASIHASSPSAHISDLSDSTEPPTSSPSSGLPSTSEVHPDASVIIASEPASPRAILPSSRPSLSSQPQRKCRHPRIYVIMSVTPYLMTPSTHYSSMMHLQVLLTHYLIILLIINFPLLIVTT